MIATVEANPKYIMELAGMQIRTTVIIKVHYKYFVGNMDNVFRFHTDPHRALSQKLAERINSIGAGERYFLLTREMYLIQFPLNLRITKIYKGITRAYS